MKRKELFKNMLSIAEKENLFIGFGNLEANILIVGKEASVELTDIEQSDREIRDNILQWKKDIDKQQSEIATMHEGVFSPLYPYKGQIKKIDSQIRNKNAKCNYGTSPTWLNYQKLHDAVYEDKENKSINFHEHCFMTELNQITSRYSSHQDKNSQRRKKSVNERIKNIFESEYIQSFPIVLFVCGTYVHKFKIDLCSLFDVKFQYRNDISNNNKEWNSIFTRTDGAFPKLVIHSRQLSMTSDSLIESIAKEVRGFCKDYNIML